MVEAMKGGGHCIFVSNMEDEDGKTFYVWFFLSFGSIIKNKYVV
jgi:hypothetical protein